MFVILNSLIKFPANPAYFHFNTVNFSNASIKTNTILLFSKKWNSLYVKRFINTVYIEYIYIYTFQMSCPHCILSLQLHFRHTLISKRESEFNTLYLRQVCFHCNSSILLSFLWILVRLLVLKSKYKAVSKISTQMNYIYFYFNLRSVNHDRGLQLSGHSGVQDSGNFTKLMAVFIRFNLNFYTSSS